MDEEMVCDGCGSFNEPELFCRNCVMKDQKDLQGAYNIAMKEINRLRKLLGYDS